MKCEKNSQHNQMFHIRKKQYRHKRQAIMRSNVQKKRKNAKTEVEKQLGTVIAIQKAEQQFFSYLLLV